MTAGDAQRYAQTLQSLRSESKVEPVGSRVVCAGEGHNICARRPWGAKEVRGRARQGRWRVLRRLLSARQPPRVLSSLLSTLYPCNPLGVTAV